MVIAKPKMFYFVIKLCSKTDISPADLKLGHVTVMCLLIAKLLSIANCSTGEWNKALAGVLYQLNGVNAGHSSTLLCHLWAATHIC